MKFTIVEKSCIDQAPILEISSVNKRKYADIHGYTLFTDDHLYNQTKYRNWMKIEAILKCFDTDCDWIVWTDADMLIMNQSITLESFTEDTNRDIIMAFFPIDYHTKIRTGYNHSYTLHAGMIFIRNTLWAKDFLIECYNDDKYSNDLMTEEAAITDRYRINPDVKKHIKIINLDKICTIPPHPYPETTYLKQYVPGDYVIHFLGKSIEEKIREVKRYSGKEI